MRSPWSGVRQLLTPAAEKYIITVCLCCLNLGWGTIVVIPGPTLLDLQRQINGSTTEMNYAFLARTLGYLISAPLGGVLAWCTLQMSVVTSSVVIGASTLAIPWCRHSWQLSTVFGFHGIALGTFDIVSTVLLIQLWKDHKACFIQLVNVVGYVGDLVAPTLARPYISTEDLVSHANVTSHPFVGRSRPFRRRHGWPTWKISYYSDWPGVKMEDDSNLKSLYSILASYELVFALFFFLTVIYFREMQKHDRYEQDHSKGDKSENQESWFFVVGLIVLSCCMQFLSGGAVALAVGSYGMEYIVRYRGRTVDDAILASTIFASSSIVVGLLSIAALKFVRVDIIIKMNVFFQSFGAIFFLFGAFDFKCFCTGLAIVAAALSSFTTTNICWATDRIGRPAIVASVVALGYPLGEMLYPLIIGLYFDRDPNSLLYALFCNSMILVFLYTIGEIMSRAKSAGRFKDLTVDVDVGFLAVVFQKCHGCLSVFRKDDREEVDVLMEQTDDTPPMTVTGYLVQPRPDTRSRTPFDADSE